MTIEIKKDYHRDNDLFIRHHSFKNVYYNQEFNISVVEAVGDSTASGSKINYSIGRWFDFSGSLIPLRDLNDYPIKDVTRELLALSILKHSL